MATDPTCSVCGKRMGSPAVMCLPCASRYQAVRDKLQATAIAQGEHAGDPAHPAEFMDLAGRTIDPLRATLWRCMRRQPEHRAMYLASYTMALTAALPTLAAINDATRLLELVRDHPDTPEQYRTGLTRAIQAIDLARTTRTAWDELEPTLNAGAEHGPEQQ